MLLLLAGTACGARGDGPPPSRDLSQVVFSSPLGGSGYDSVRGLAHDRDGNLYVTGGTSSRDFPVTKGAWIQSYQGGPVDGYVAKIDPAGLLVWATYLGGPSYDRAYAIEVDAEGRVWVAGRAGEGFPTTPGAFQPEFQGGPRHGPYPPEDGFVLALRPDGSGPVFSSYFGARDDPEHIIRDIALAPGGGVYLAASSDGGDYPPGVREAFPPGARPAGGSDGVIARVAPDGSQLLWARYLGGSGDEMGQPALRVDARGDVFYMTVTESADMPTTEGAWDRHLDGRNDFHLSKLDDQGQLLFGTYLGGSGEEMIETHTLALDPAGNPVLTGSTLSQDYPTTEGALQRRFGGAGGRGQGRRTNYPGDTPITRLSADGSRLLASTLLGGRYGEAGEGIAVDDAGRIYVVGATFSDDFPITPGALQSRLGGRANAYAAVLSADLSRLEYSTFVGGETLVAGRALTLTGPTTFVLGGLVGKPGTGWPLVHAGVRAAPPQENAVLLSLDWMRGR
ncbi:MAG: SBBP repeat-containing protein [Myxococcota bacterium]